MNEINSSSGAEALGLSGPVEWSDFFEYEKRIHKKLIDCKTATKPASFFRIVPSKRKKHNAGVNAGQAVEVII